MKRNATNIIKEQIPRFALLAVWAVLCAWFFGSKLQYHFYYQEQCQLFVNDSGYIYSYFEKPAWAACLLGDYLTQFYHYSYVGPIVLTATLLVFGDFVRRAIYGALYPSPTIADMMRVPSAYTKFIKHLALGIAIVLMTLEARFCISTDFRLGNIIAFVGGAALWCIHNWGNSFCKTIWWARLASFALTSFFTYWMFGYSVFAIIIFEITRLIVLKSQRELQYWQLAPYAFAFIFVPVCINKVAPSYNLTTHQAFNYPGVWEWESYHEAMTLEKVLYFENEYANCNYQKVIEMGEKVKNTDQESPGTSFYLCLTLAKNDLLPDMIQSVNNPKLGTDFNLDKDTPLHVVRMANEFFYLVGDMASAERAAMLANSMTKGGRNVKMIQRLVEINLVKGDDDAAIKYARMLYKSEIYRDWALQHTPGQLSSQVKKQIAEKKKLTNKVKHSYHNIDVREILTQLLVSNPKNTIALDYLLCSDITNGDEGAFAKDYERFGPRNKPYYKQDSQVSQ